MCVYGDIDSVMVVDEDVVFIVNTSYYICTYNSNHPFLFIHSITYLFMIYLFIPLFTYLPMCSSIYSFTGELVCHQNYKESYKQIVIKM